MTWSPDRAAPVLAVILCVLVLASCASLDRQRTDSALFELSYGFYTLDPTSLRMVPLESAAPASDLVLVFPAVPGAIMGAPRGAPLQTVPVDSGAGFELRLPATLDARASRFTSDSLSIDPAGTRVARLGTFHEYPEYGVFRGGGGFIDTRSGDPLLLVHFSNPAKLSGVVQDRTGTYEYDVTVARAGWSWLIIRGQGDDTFRVQAYTGPVDTIEFGVLLPPAMLGGA